MVTLALIGLVGGLITGISPCILPVLPVIFLSGGVQGARTAEGGRRSGRRPYLVVAGLTLSFSVFTLVGTLALSSLPVPQDIIRWAGLVLLVLLGAGMMSPRVEAWLEKPFSRLPQRQVGADRGGFVLGLVLGTVYVPCAGPVLAAITVAGATGRVSGHILVLTLAFAIGTAIPLLVFALAGRGLAERLRVFRSHQRRIRVCAGVVVIALAVALTTNLTDAVQRAIPDYTSALNKGVNGSGDVTRALGSGGSAALAACAQNPDPTAGLQNCGAAPAISGIQQWLNTPKGMPISLRSLKGKVVLVDFWAYSCINCQRAITHVTSWYSTYQADGLVVIGVHTPEYAFEHVPGNVAAGAKRLGITYPVALDNTYTTWNNFGNDSWPAEYLIDANGTVRYASIGEGDYGHTESLIRQLLTAAHPGTTLPAATRVADTTPTFAYETPETYLGAERANNFAYGPTLSAGTRTYHYPSSVPGDSFALSGTWSVGGQALTAKSTAGIALNFDANDVYLDVGGTGTVTATVDGRTTAYRISGSPDIHTLVSRRTARRSTLRVTLSPGLSAYSFTFG
ncbi:cytochrome c biogenesis protein DipZ [Streptantibioticus silvisoli]|uniref:Cytochrome c biogenesis protein DipZ n=1 Tax=Streptantibioticus silvisoli TaxID=2705255 RepID=A0ABT6VV79_9ACTN|nr:cytochrome c biogenesis protein DipZ [Streptantibioticus silvisoli]MDI5962383.1 cytochrome c biogenesis protein DipZ [Streptantibioticus silvisoli]